jgi:hypothetical protein
MLKSPAVRLTARELSLIQKVLSDHGYAGDTLGRSAMDYSTAAKFLITLVQRGITDHTRLAKALEEAFG